MATRFEIALHGDNAASLRAAGEAALDEIDRIESLLSLYRPETDIARVNAAAHAHPVRVTPEVFRLLQRARELSNETGGAFDFTIAPLVRCWGFMGGTGAMPSAESISAARECVGMGLVDLRKDDYSVSFCRPGVMLDLGAIGKGYAIDCAVEVLREAGVASALVHGGTSSTYALGRQPSGENWKIAITSPHTTSDDNRSTTQSGAAPTAVAVVEVEDESLSVSAVWGRSFRAGGKTFGHVIDPRTGMPAENALMTAIVLPSATEGDALTTALLTEPSLIESICPPRSGIRCLVVRGDETAPEIIARGL